jgi:hypothetical protein
MRTPERTAFIDERLTISVSKVNLLGGTLEADVASAPPLFISFGVSKPIGHLGEIY